MKYRSRVDIIATLLQAASPGATKTRLMYSAYLSYSQTKEYLDFLMTKGLLTPEDGTRLYRRTDNGLRFLEAYQQLSSLIVLQDNRKVQNLNAGLPFPKQTSQPAKQ